MIQISHGDLLKSDADALVNTVNCVGVMGKGIALAFKKAYPGNYKAYGDACKAGGVATGTMFVTEPGDMFGPKWIVNFPTKRHWRDPSQMAWIESGLEALVAFVKAKQIRSIAIPALGCSNGGLAWEQVRPRIENAFRDLVETQVTLFTGIR